MKRLNYKLSKDLFVERSNKMHNFKYDYSKVVYKNHRTKVIITCPIHGDFEQTPKNHMKGQGCPKCGKKYASEWGKNDYKNFMKSSIERFGDIYEFPNIESEYENSHSKITIKCKKCGNTFIKIACDHITSPNGGCMHCYANKSKPELEIVEFVKNIVGKEHQIITNDRNILNGSELDLVIPSLKFAIEFNGLFWHSNKSKNYHLLKSEICESRGIRLFQIFEDEYTFHKEIVFSKIKHTLKKDYNLEKVYGRDCKIKEITYNDSKEFLDKNHIQGNSKSTIYLGAFKNETIVGVMNFTRLVDNEWELNRFATDINLMAVGIGGKIFSYFIKKYSPTLIKSFADRRWTDSIHSNLYDKLGFKLEKILKPDYKYFINGSKNRLHKFGFRKQILHKKYGFPLTMTETEMTKKIGANKIWDCGLLKYIWKKE